MPSRLILAVLVAICFVRCQCAVLAIDPTPVNAPGGKTPLELAQLIADEATGVVVNAATVSTTVNDPANGSPATDTRTYGDFTSGVTTLGTALPTVNGGPTATYTAGIGIDTGVCLSTGRLTDGVSEPAQGVGVEGPNNGNGLTDDGTASNQGEISTVIFAPANQPELNIGKDADFVQAIFSANDPGGGDAAVLQFNVNTSAPGFLRTSFVFGSDEAPFFLTQEFNDSFAILIDGKNVATIVESGMSKPFTLQDVAQCPQIYLKNDVAPQPSALNGSAHGTPGAPLYNTEFGGFTTRLTRESSIPLAPGTHTIKIVIQDVADRRLDSALFIQENSLKLFPFLVADFDLDGDIDGRDFLTWQRNYLATNATFQQGDANGDGTVDTQDLVIWGNNYGQSGGNKNYCSDFDRDGDADGRDFLIWQRGFGMEHCASRFEGDANGDGAVDSCDLSIWQAEANAAPLAVCACDGGEMAAMAGGGLAEGTDDFDPADANQDGKVNASDVALWLDFYREVEK